MICPNKNSAEWKSLEHLGQATLITYNQEKTQVTGNEEVWQKIFSVVTDDPEYFHLTYKHLWEDRHLSPIQMTEFFYSRFDGLSPKIEGEHIATIKGNMTLFPEVDAYANKRVIPNESLAADLNLLQSKFNIPFITIDDPSQKFKGRYVNQGNKKAAVINLAYATKETPLHEVYHPFVRRMRFDKPTVFNYILQQASNIPGDAEEKVVVYLTKQATSKWAKISLALKFFLAYVKNLLGLKNDLTELSRLKDVLAELRHGIDLSQESTLTSAYQKIDELENLMSQKFGAVTKTDYISLIEKDGGRFTTNDSSSFYLDETGKEIAKRLTAMIGDAKFGEFSKKFAKYQDTSAQWAAKRFFRANGVNVDKLSPAEITQTIKLGDKDVTFQEVTQYMEKQAAYYRTWGKLVHAYMQYTLETDPSKRALARAQAVSYADALGEPYNGLEAHRAVRNINENIDNILEEAGIILDLSGHKGIPKAKQDKLAAEAVIVSDLLVDKDGNKIGTTADGIVQHFNGDMSLVDWKTGNITSDMSTPYLLDYGDKYGINDSKLSKAYLELTFRAMMLKEKYPDMKFRSIKLVRIDHNGVPTAMELDLQPYLYTIGDYYKETNPDVYQKLLDKGLLNQSVYQGEAAPIVDLAARIAHLSRADKILYLQSKLAAIHQGKSKQQIAASSEIREASRPYTEALLALQSEEAGIDLKTKTEDLNSLWGFKNFSDISNPKVQTLHKLLLKAKKKTQDYMGGVESKHNELYTNVLTESKGRSKALDLLAGAANIYGLVQFSPLWFFGSILAHKVLSRTLNEKTKDHFAFMWRQSTDLGRQGWYMNTKDTYLKDGVEVPMSKAQIAYRDFIHETMKSAYDEFANEIVGYKFGDETRPLYRYEQLGMPSSLPLDFMPRVPKTTEEIREEEDFSTGAFGLKTTVGMGIRQSLTSFFEDKYTDDKGGIPIKYFKHEGSSIVTENNHSWNAETAFKFFMTSLKNKQHLDPVYELSLGVRNALAEEKDEAGNPKYDNLVKWLDSQVTMQLLNNQDDVKLATKKITLKLNSIGEKLTGIPEGTQLVVSQNSILKALKRSVTYSIMSFKLWAPIRNALLISAANVTQTTRKFINGRMSAVLGVPPESFDTINLDGGRVAFIDYLKHKLSGKEDNSKLWNLAKKLDWLPDNYPYEVNHDRLLSKSINLSLTSNAFLFYELGENFGALWQLAGLMKSIKIQDKDGKQVSMWDAYNDKGEWTLGARGVIENADGTTQELTDLTELEIKALKRSYEKLNGSYRKEEKTAIEATVIGDFIMQFHKYFYQYLKVLFASPYKDITVGKYVLTGKRPDGMPVYQWHSEVMEGQLRVLVTSIFAAMSRKGKQYLLHSNFGENTLKGHRARALAGLLNTFLWFAMLMLTFKLSLDDDEEKSYLGRSIARTIEDLSRGLSPKDLLDTVQKPIVAVDRISKTGMAFFDLMTEGITGDTDRYGWPTGARTVGRSIPGLAGSMQIADLLANDSEDSDHLFGIVPVKP